MPGSAKDDWIQPPAETVNQWAAHVAARFDVSDPRGALACVGVGLRVARAPLRASGKQIFGAWDPQLRRIELFGCDRSRSDKEIVASLGHEMWHMMNGVRGRIARHEPSTARDEDAARQFATAWTRRLGPKAVRRCAQALRSLADKQSTRVAKHGKRGILNIGE